MEGCSPPKKVKKVLAGAQYQSRLKRIKNSCIPYLKYQIHLENFVVPSSCSHQDEADVKRHIQGGLHQNKLKSLKSMETLSRPNNDSITEQVSNDII